MPRKGRETELVLKELESLSLKDQAEIKSPDFIRDVVTGQKREVDISIRFKVGTHEFLTVIECRDRKKSQDATWIEQIVTKTRNIHANRVIAVSTSGFTDGAKKLAEHENVILRTLRDFKADEAIEWMDKVTFELRERQWDPINMQIELIDEKLKDESKGKLKEMNIQFNLHKKEFKVASTGEYVSINDIINSANKNNGDFLFNDLNDGDPPVIKRALLEFAQENKHFIEIDDKNYYIKFMDVELKCWVETKIIPLKKALRYEENHKPVLDKVDYEFSTLDKKKVFLSLTKDHETCDGILNAYYTDSKDNNLD